MILALMFMLATLGVPPYGTPSVGSDEPVKVLVVNQTQGNWAGIHDAVQGWDASPYVDLMPALRCHPEAYCVVITRPGLYPDSEWLGLWVGTSEARSTILLDTGPDFNDSPAHQRKVIAHELGHALGLQHTDRHGSVMGPDVIGVPTKWDLLKLAAIHDNPQPRAVWAYRR